MKGTRVQVPFEAGVEQNYEEMFREKRRNGVIRFFFFHFIYRKFRHVRSKNRKAISDHLRPVLFFGTIRNTEGASVEQMTESKLEGNMKKRSFSEDMSGAWKLMGQKAQVLIVVQSVLSVALLLAILIDFMRGTERLLMIRIELCLAIALLIVSALRSYPEHKKTIVLYVFCTVAVVVCLIMNCL